MMPDKATWDDLIHEIYVREVIERGLADSKAGQTTVGGKFVLSTVFQNDRSLDKDRASAS